MCAFGHCRQALHSAIDSSVQLPQTRRQVPVALPAMPLHNRAQCSRGDSAPRRAPWWPPPAPWPAPRTRRPWSATSQWPPGPPGARGRAGGWRVGGVVVKSRTWGGQRPGCLQQPFIPSTHRLQGCSLCPCPSPAELSPGPPSQRTSMRLISSSSMVMRYCTSLGSCSANSSSLAGAGSAPVQRSRGVGARALSDCRRVGCRWHEDPCLSLPLPQLPRNHMRRHPAQPQCPSLPFPMLTVALCDGRRRLLSLAAP